jgi:hypothetical protein
MLSNKVYTMRSETNDNSVLQPAKAVPACCSMQHALSRTEAVDSVARQTLNLTQIATFQSLREKLRALYRRDQYEIHEHVLEFHDRLKRKYPAAREYLLFHLISGSTFPDFNGNFDFPFPDSVEAFVLEEYAKAFPA